MISTRRHEVSEWTVSQGSEREGGVPSGRGHWHEVGGTSGAEGVVDVVGLDRGLICQEKWEDADHGRHCDSIRAWGSHSGMV